MIRLALLGSSGKTGAHVRSLIENSYSDVFKVTLQLSRRNSGADLKNCDGVIDFSSPTACLGFMRDSSPDLFWVVGSTGWSDQELSELTMLSQKRLILKSSNFSLGITVLNDWLKQSATLLEQFGFQVSMSETHHTHKKDSPSGTALLLKNTLSHSGFSNIPISSEREGDVVGDHSVLFSSDRESISLSHSAKDRSVFAQGAIEAARWLAKLKRHNPGEVGIKTLILQQN